jgi:hypothetical protein
MKEIRILFTDAYEPLGEIVCEDGRFFSATLTQTGEERIGDDVVEWQNEGVPMLSDEFRQSDGEYRATTRIIRVKRNNHQFISACTEWAVTHGFHVVSFMENRMTAWEKILVLSLSPHERFAFALVASRLPNDAFETWLKKIDKAAVRAERKILQMTEGPQFAGAY